MKTYNNNKKTYRIIVVSDIHGRTSYLYDIIEKHSQSSDLLIFLGDGENNLKEVLQVYPNIELNIEQVCGNCDWSSVTTPAKTICCNNKKIFFTHGHNYYVKHGYELLIQKAEHEKVNICLFGHTHIPYTDYLNDIYYLNPGSLHDGNYALIDITENGIMIIPEKI